MGSERIVNEQRLAELVEQKKLVPLLTNKTLVINQTLPKNRRYVLPYVNVFLERLSDEFYAQFGSPLQVNSAVRPVTVQKKLRRVNRSAAPIHGETASSHEAGCTVDIERRRLTKTQRSWMEYRLAYYMLTERIIEEEESSCFHTMVLGDLP